MKKIIGGQLTTKNAGILPLSKAVQTTGLIFVSGQLGLNTAGDLVGDGIEAQTDQAIANIAAVLSEAGLTLEHVVKVTGWLTHAEDFPAFNRAYARAFPSDPPARSMVVSGLLIPGARIELEAVAALP